MGVTTEKPPLADHPLAFRHMQPAVRAGQNPLRNLLTRTAFLLHALTPRPRRGTKALQRTLRPPDDDKQKNQNQQEAHDACRA